MSTQIMNGQTQLLKKSIFRMINWISRSFFASRLSFSHVEAFLYCNSFKKFKNLIQVHIEKRRGISKVKSHPYLFVFEITNICNLKCPFCLTGKGISGGRSVRHMKFEEAKQIIDEVGDYLYMVQLYTWGEPLLNKDIYDIIKYAQSKNIYTMLSTNATAMSETNNQRLIDSGLNYIMVAIDGGSNETYQKYRIGGNYDEVLVNLKSLIQKRKENKVSHPFIEWQFIVFSHNEHEVESTQNFAYEIGVNKFTPLPAYVEDEAFQPKSDKYRVDMLNPERLKDCDRPWTHLNIRADGGVASCCYEFFKKDDFGNAINSPFKEIWNNDFFQKSRRMITQRTRNLPLEDGDIICKSCLETGIRPSFIEATAENSKLNEIKIKAIPVASIRPSSHEQETI